MGELLMIPNVSRPKLKKKIETVLWATNPTYSGSEPVDKTADEACVAIHDCDSIEYAKV